MSSRVIATTISEHAKQTTGRLSIAEVSAFGYRKRSIAIVLRAAFDGSGTTLGKHLTLSMVGAEDSAWTTFEQQWGAVLERFQVPYSHMHELVSKNKSKDSPFLGWDEWRGHEFTFALMNVIGSLHHSLTLASLTISMKDYRDLAQKSSVRVKPAPAICVDYCMAHVLEHPHFFDGHAEMFFDKDEEFIRFLESIWSRNKRKQLHWANNIAVIAPVDMQQLIPVQGADLLAWSMNRYHSRVCRDDEIDFDIWQSNAALLAVMSTHSQLYGRAELEEHPGFYGWKLPPKGRKGY